MFRLEQIPMILDGDVRSMIGVLIQNLNLCTWVNHGKVYASTIHSPFAMPFGVIGRNDLI